MTYRDLILKAKNLDEEIDLNLLTKDKNRAYIYITGHKDKKVPIDGDICYEVSEMIPGSYSFDEAKEIIKLIFGDTWHLPSKDVLNLIYDNLKITRQIEDNEYYWSSSIYDDNNDYAWMQNFSCGSQLEVSKFCLNRVRAIRPFNKEFENDERS